MIVLKIALLANSKLCKFTTSYLNKSISFAVWTTLADYEKKAEYELNSNFIYGVICDF